MNDNVKLNDYKKSIVQFASSSKGLSKIFDVIPEKPSSFKINNMKFINRSLKTINEINLDNIESPQDNEQNFTTNFFTPRSSSRFELKPSQLDNISITQSPHSNQSNFTNNFFTPRSSSRFELKTPQSVLKLVNSQPSSRILTETKDSSENLITTPRIFGSTMTILPKMSSHNNLRDRNILTSSNERKSFFNSPDQFIKQASERIKLLHNKIDTAESLELSLSPELYYDERHRVLLERLKAQSIKKIDNGVNIKSILSNLTTIPNTF